MDKNEKYIDHSLINRDWLEALINSMIDSIIAVDKNFKVIHYNANTLSLLNRNTSILNKSIDSILNLYNSKDDKISVKDILRHTKKPALIDDYILKFESDNSQLNLSISISPVYLGFGKEDGGFLIILRDITKDKSLDQERDEFISVVSHELRNPIAIAEGNLSNIKYALENHKDITNFNLALKKSYDQIIFLSDLINGLTSLNRAEKNKIPETLDKINPQNLVDELMLEFNAKATDKKLELESQCSPNLEVITSSLLYVKEILQNFITNAIKYSDSGKIIISAKSTKNLIKFSVTDNGIGIKQADQSKVFDKFYRAEDFHMTSTNGTGLGLYIAKKLADIICAEISLTSVLNHGSTFSLTLPININMESKTRH